MAETLGPRVPDAPGRLYGGDQRRLWGATGQLQRQRVTIPPAAAPSGAGEFSSTLLVSSGPLAGGFGSAGFYASAWDVMDTQGDSPPTLTPEVKTGGEVYLRPDKSGWYFLHARFGVGFSAGGGSRLGASLRGPHDSSGFGDVHATQTDLTLSSDRPSGILAADGTLSCAGWIDPALSDALIYAEVYANTPGTLCSPTSTAQDPFIWLQVMCWS